MQSFYENKYIKEDFETKYVPHIFEDICRQYLIRMNRMCRLMEPFESIGKYYYDDPVNRKNGEFNIVTKDDKGYIFYEAKFRKDPVTDAVIEQEIAQVQRAGLSVYRYGFISRSGFQCQKRQDLILIDLKDLYA